jgi:PRTRC genetic system ThiF family protein
MKHYILNTITNPNRPVNIDLVGCGGTGCQILSGLARINVSLLSLGHRGISVIVCDPDKVTEANIGRQLFSPADIGRYKAETLVTRLNQFYGFKFKAIPQYYEKYKRRERDVNILITAVDTVKARLAIAKFIKKQSCYHLDTGNTRHTGQVILGTTKTFPQPESDKKAIGKLPTVTELYNLNKVDEKVQGPSCSLAAALEQQDLMINQMVATCALNLLWECFRYGVIVNHGAFINLSDMKVNPLPIDAKVWKRLRCNKKGRN